MDQCEVLLCTQKVKRIKENLSVECAYEDGNVHDSNSRNAWKQGIEERFLFFSFSFF